jgi:hypothetical protein
MNNLSVFESPRAVTVSSPFWRAVAAIVVCVAGLIVLPDTAEAQNLIKRPGAHNRYSFELEPQLVVRTAGPRWGTYYCDDRGPGRSCRGYYGGYGGWMGVGPGVRVNIPFMHNGPIDEINNNIGISFGGSLTFHGYYGYRATVLNLPVAFQWNFYFTEIISVLGEAGLNTPVTFWNGGTNFAVEPLFQGGGRFQFGKVGVVARVGWPLLSVGANFQF